MKKYNRKSIRLPHYDYSQPGYYFVTICTQDKKHLFGKIEKGKMILNEKGKIIKQTWLDLPKHNPHIKIDVFVIMPDHFHGILIINDYVHNSHYVGAGSKPAQNSNPSHDKNTNQKRAGHGPAPTYHGLPEIIRQFKSFSAKRINKLSNTPGQKIWQRGYYEHIIRNERSLYEYRHYIKCNPLKWELDRYYRGMK